MLFTSFGFILLHANSGPFDNRSYMCHCLGVKKDLGAEFFLSSNGVFFGEGLDRLESLSLTALALIAPMQLPISFNFTVLECLVWFCRFFVFSLWYDLVVSQSKLLLASSQRCSCLKLTVFSATSATVPSLSQCSVRESCASKFWQQCQQVVQLM